MSSFTVDPTKCFKVLSVFCVVNLFSQQVLFAQDTDSSNKHSLNVEALGRSIIWSSFNYEYQLSLRFSLGTGLGFTGFQRGIIMRDNNGIQESGRYFDVQSSQMIFANYFLGEKKHKLLFTAGLTNFWSWSRNEFDSETEFFSNTQIRWNFGLGYHYSGERMFFRFTGYAVRMPEPIGWFPKIFPWLGITLGHRF